MGTTRTKGLQGSAIAIAGVLLLAVNLRAAVAGLSPIYDIVDRDVPLGIDARAVLGSLPPIGFVIGGLLTPRLTRRIGLEWNLVTLVGVIVVGHILRALATDWTVLALGSAIALIGSGMGNVSLPPTIKKYFPHHIGVMSAAYISFVSIGSVVAPLIAVPLSEASSWRMTMVLWAAVATLAFVPWIAELRAGRHSLFPVNEVRGEHLPLTKSPTAWAIAVAFAVSAITGYAMFAWLPDIAKDAAHLSEFQGGLLLSVFAFAGTPMALLAPLIAARARNIGWLTAVGGFLIVVGFGAMLLAPTVAPFLWTVIFGVGPLLFPLSLALINVRTETTSASLQLSAFTQFIGYGVAVFVPPLMGLARAMTGSWSLVLACLAMSGLGAAWAAVVLARNNTVEDEILR